MKVKDYKKNIRGKVTRKSNTFSDPLKDSSGNQSNKANKKTKKKY